MKISCIVPIYNTARYLKKCMESVLNQTYSNFEIVLVNDCSTDNSADVCRKYAESYPDKVVFIDKNVNEGVDMARFDGLKYVFMNNPFGAVMFVDSDDYIGKESLELLMREMENGNSDIVEMGMVRFWGPIKQKGHFPIPPQTIRQPALYDDYFLSFFGINLLNVSMCAKLYRVETLAKANLKPSGFRMGEDLMFNFKLFPHLERYSIIDYYGYFYRIGGLTSGYNPYLWDNLKDQYFIKRQCAIDYNYDKAIRPLNIELKNILLSTVCQQMNYISEKEIKDWLKNILNDLSLWNDINELVKDEEDKDFQLIRSKDVEGIIVRAKGIRGKNRLKSLLKKILTVLEK